MQIVSSLNKVFQKLDPIIPDRLPGLISTDRKKTNKLFINKKH